VNLTAAQLQTLKNAIAAETDAAFVAMRQAGETGAMADWYNAASSPAFYVYRSSTATAAIFAAVTWANLTPADTPDGTATYTNRALLCQAKQMNLQILLQGRTTIDSSDATIRGGLQDALTAVPSGANGASQNAGAGAVKAAMTRQTTKGERLFATGTGTTGSPGALGAEGAMSNENIVAALAA